MKTIVDFASFSFPINISEEIPLHALFHKAIEALDLFSPKLFELLVTGEEWKPSSGRAPYSHSWTWAKKGVRLFASPRQPHCCLEIDGTGCAKLRKAKVLGVTLEQAASRLTRLDLATDIETETDPIAFAALRDLKRFKSHSEVVSASGTTSYIGSKSSDRYARVYRYNAPHPRSKFLRIEHVTRGEAAKATVNAVLEFGAKQVQMKIAESFGWTHPDWKPEETEDFTVTPPRLDRANAKTVFWLNSTVASTLRRLAKEDGFDVQKWLNDSVVNYDPRKR